MSKQRPPTANRRSAWPRTVLAYASATLLLYLLALGPLSRLKSSGALDRVPGGCQAMDAFACPGLIVLWAPGLGVAYEAYLRWWDDIDQPG